MASRSRGVISTVIPSRQVLGCLLGPVRLLVIDTDQHQDVVGHDGPVGGLKTHVRDVGLGAGQDGGHGAGMGGVGIEADTGVDGGCGGTSGVVSPAGGRTVGSGHRRTRGAIGLLGQRGRPWWSADRRGAPSLRRHQSGGVLPASLDGAEVGKGPAGADDELAIPVRRRAADGESTVWTVFTG
jgi:hypothetical protein